MTVSILFINFFTLCKAVLPLILETFLSEEGSVREA
jgi:hypothetical protein